MTEENYLFLKKYQKLQLSIAYDALTDVDFAIIGSSKLDPSVYWNSALTDQILSDDQIGVVEAIFADLERIPTFYYENKPKLNDLSTRLKSRGYEESFEDSWLFWTSQSIDTKHFESVRKVNTKVDLELFLKTLDASYQVDDPQNPYGELGEYLESARRAWEDNHISGKVEYFIVFKSDTPVSVASLTNYRGIGYISNVGSLKEVRGEGYGKAATHFCVNESLSKGNSAHCLATEEGDYPNEFYKRIGFKDAFRAIAYTKYELR